jgi:quinol monooxygenase YgiN
MVKGIWFYEVAQDKQTEYLQKTKEIIKPFWESNECLSYEVYQDPENPRQFVKIQVYEDMAAMQRDGALLFEKKDPQAIEAVETFRSYAENMISRFVEMKVGPDRR